MTMCLPVCVLITIIYLLLYRDESHDTTKIVPACTVRWAHSNPTLLITYEDGIMKLVKVTSETNSSHISVDNISFSVSQTVCLFVCLSVCQLSVYTLHV